MNADDNLLPQYKEPGHDITSNGIEQVITEYSRFSNRGVNIKFIPYVTDTFLHIIICI